MVSRCGAASAATAALTAASVRAHRGQLEVLQGDSMVLSFGSPRRSAAGADDDVAVEGFDSRREPPRRSARRSRSSW